MVGQEALERGGLERRCEQVALAAVAAEFLQAFELGMSSMPSATVRRPRLRPSWTSVWIRASDSGECDEAAMNVRSILSESTGNCCR